MVADPAVTVPRITKAPSKPPVDGCILAMPFTSEITGVCDVPSKTGSGLVVMLVSPPDTIVASLFVRPSNDWKSTLAPSTGFGGIYESVIRTVIG